MATAIRQSMVAFLSAVVLTGVWHNVLAQEQVFTDDVRLRKDYPILILDDIGSIDRVGAPPWKISNGRGLDDYRVGSFMISRPGGTFLGDSDTPFVILQSGHVVVGNSERTSDTDPGIGSLTVIASGPGASPKLRLSVSNASNNDDFPFVEIPNEAWEMSRDPAASDPRGFTLSSQSQLGTSSPFSVASGTPTDTLRLTRGGHVGVGTLTPNVIGAVAGTGRFLNLRASGTSGSTGVANLVTQGQLGAQLHLVHNGAPANQRVMRFQCSGGLTSFHVLNDSLASYAIANALTVKMSNGNIGLRVANPTQPLHLASGAHCTTGGVWTNASSRSVKQDIEPITSEQARETVRKLQPVGYRYKNELDEKYVGFIAEDVPELVATNDRKSLAAMDIAAVLTRVVQDQDRLLDEERRTNIEQRKTLDRQQRSLEQQQKLIEQQRDMLSLLQDRMTEVERKQGNDCR